MHFDTDCISLCISLLDLKFDLKPKHKIEILINSTPLFNKLTLTTYCYHLIFTIYHIIVHDVW